MSYLIVFCESHFTALAALWHKTHKAALLLIRIASTAVTFHSGLLNHRDNETRAVGITIRQSTIQLVKWALSCAARLPQPGPDNYFSTIPVSRI